MKQTIRIWWTWAVEMLVNQLLVAVAAGGVVTWHPAFHVWLDWGIGGVWLLLTWRGLARRLTLTLTAAGVRNHGRWRTRLICWDDVVHFEPFMEGNWESPAALLPDGRLLVLDGVRGLRSDAESPVDRVVVRLNATLDRFSP